MRFDGTEMITLPQGRLQACKFTHTTSSGGSPVSVETFYRAPGVNLVKSYFLVTNLSDSDYNQTNLTELATTTAAVTLSVPTSDTAPSLATCSALPTGLNLTYTSSTSNEAASGRRATMTGTLQGTSTVAVTRRHVGNNALQSTFHHSSNIGFLTRLGSESADGSSITILTGQPDVRDTAANASVDFVRTDTTYLSGTLIGTPVVSNNRFTNMGHEKVTTPVGTLDACKVRFFYGNSGNTETYWLAPNGYWVRLENLDPAGVRTSREMISR